MKANKFPGYNCGQCGFKTCEDLEIAITKNKAKNTCVFFMAIPTIRTHKLTGLVDGLEADFVLGPLRNEKSCRERLFPLTPKGIKIGDYIRYRPIGCPITHFAKIIDYKDGLITVHIVGPRLPNKYIDIGLCLVIGFEGIVKEGRVPNVCETIRFIPEKCQMQAVHSGKVLEVIGNKVKIEGVDLKVFGK